MFFSPPSTSGLTSGNIITNISGSQASLKAKIYFLKKEKDVEKNNLFNTKTVLWKHKQCLMKQGNDKLIVVYTGLPNHSIFEALFNLIKDEKVNYYLGLTVDKLLKIDHLLMCLMIASTIDPSCQFSA